ncbi:MAG TPA: hypothetical protein VF169_19915 [Albitalea sp.]|uniref:hypothetical protein n=1 Tax=Piscinibacter sp. TaxID=1903157 RepID=UPI002ED12429
MSTTTRKLPGVPLKALALAASLAAAAAAHAEDRPWYIGASQAFTHDSNVFRTVGSRTADTISSTSVLGGLDLNPGRQHLYLDAIASRNRFNKLDQLNNDSHSISGGLDWETVEHLSGHLRATSRQNLTDYTVIGTPEVKNIEKIQTASAGIRYGFTSVLGVEGRVEHRKVDLSVSNERDSTQRVGSLGLRYDPGGQLTFGTAVRVTKGDTPLYAPLLPLDVVPVPTLGPVEPDEMDRKDIDFTVNWVPSGLSKVHGRISLSRENHTAPSRGDFHGVSGAVTWEYEATGKTKIRSSLIRDTGNETSFLALERLGLTNLRFDNNRLNWVALVEADWAATAKILVNGSFRYIRGTLDTATGSNFNSNTTKIGLSARYVPTRAVALGCNIGHEQGSNSFRSDVFGCFGQFVIQ